MEDESKMIPVKRGWPMKKSNIEYAILMTLIPLYLALMCLSLLVEDTFPMLVLSGVTGGILFVILFLNALFLFLKRDRYHNSRKVLDSFAMEKAFDPRKDKNVLRKPVLFLLLGYLYLLLVLLSLFFLGFSVVSFMRIHVAYVIPAFALSLLLATVTTALIGPFLSERKKSVVLRKESDVHRLLVKAFPKKAVRVLLVSGNEFEIIRRPFLITWRLGTDLFSYLDDKELNGLLAYEATTDTVPILKAYHRLSKRIGRMAEWTQYNTFLNFVNILFFRILLRLQDHFCLDFLLSKKHWEEIIREDAMAKSGKAEDYLSALAKKKALSFYEGFSLPNPVYRTEKAYPIDYFLLFFQDKYKTIKENEGRFLSYLDKDKAFQQKKERFQIQRLSLKRERLSLKEEQERKDALLLLGRKHLKRWQKEYPTKRYLSYGLYQDLDHVGFDRPALSFAIHALLLEKEGKEEEAKAYYQKALLVMPNYPLALYRLGLLLLRKDDPQGVEKIRLSYQLDESYLQKGLLAIDNYRRRNALFKEKEESDQDNVLEIEKEIDCQEESELTSNSHMEEIDLPEDILSGIANLALKIPSIIKVKAIKQVSAKGTVKYHIGLLEKEKSTERKRLLAFAAFWAYLDSIPRIRFFLTPLESEKKYDVYSSYLNGKMAKTVYERKEDRDNG